MKRLILFSLICLMAIASTAQGISGRVIDEQAQPMPFANVVLVNRADSAFIAGTVTKDDGTFSISTDKQDGLLKVSSIGYITKYIDARQGNMGDIQMQPDTQMLERSCPPVPNGQRGICDKRHKHPAQSDWHGRRCIKACAWHHSQGWSLRSLRQRLANHLHQWQEDAQQKRTGAIEIH